MNHLGFGVRCQYFTPTKEEKRAVQIRLLSPNIYSKGILFLPRLPYNNREILLKEEKIMIFWSKRRPKFIEFIKIKRQNFLI